MLKFCVLVVTLWVSFSKYSACQENLLGSDIRLFKKNNWDLAQAVEKEDTIKIREILCRDKNKVDKREPRFGQTLLIWSVSEHKYNSAKILLEYGANPNLHDKDGLSAIIAAADNSETSEFLKLLLKHGGDPNNKDMSVKNILNRTPLVAAARNRLESVKILVESGAEINFGKERKGSAIFAALIGDNVEIVRYLLIEKGADFNYPMITRIDGSPAYITDLLRNWTFPLESKEYKIKMEIVDFLKKNGMDYWKTKIPEIFYNSYSKEYLDKY